MGDTDKKQIVVIKRNKGKGGEHTRGGWAILNGVRVGFHRKATTELRLGGGEAGSRVNTWLPAAEG